MVKNIDYNVVKEIDMVIANEYEDYQKEELLTKNYAKKWKKGNFDFGLAHKGVKNIIVTPRARKYQGEWGIKIGDVERDAIAKARLREIMRRIKEGDF